MHYRPLGRREIRLLTLSSGNPSSDPISGYLEHVPIKKGNSYTALSYNWGDASSTKTVFLCDNAFDVTINLYEALLQLRSRGHLRLWIDAICINQNDKYERSQQIWLMDLIYSYADLVVAWTGLETNNEGALFKNLEEETTAGKPPATVSERLRSFVQREYWERVWIIQEVALAQKLVLLCGTQEITWTRFCAAVHFLLQSEGVSNKDLALYQNLRSIIHIRWKTAEQHTCKTMGCTHKVRGCTRRIAGSPRKSIGFLPLLFQTWSAKSTEEHDKIFAVLGIAKDANGWLPMPTYCIGIEEVCFDLAMTAVRYQKRLDIIPLLGRGCDEPSVTSEVSASWIPQWHKLDGTKQQRQMNYVTTTHGDIWQEVIRSGVFAANGVEPGFPIVNDFTLMCQCIHVGNVELSGRTISEDDRPCGHAGESNNPYKSPENTFSAIYDAFSLTGSSEMNHKSVFLTKDGYQQSLRPLRRCKDAYMSIFMQIWQGSYAGSFKAQVQEWVEDHCTFSVHGRTLEEWTSWRAGTLTELTRRFEEVLGRDFVTEYDESHYIASELLFMAESGMRLMVTDKGHVGWAHERARAGDALYILQGCSVPVILRPKDDGFVVVGDAFISGLMYGEATVDASWTPVKLY